MSVVAATRKRTALYLSITGLLLMVDGRTGPGDATAYDCLVVLERD